MEGKNKFLLIFFFALLYLLYSYLSFSHFHYPARDLGEYTQVVWNLSQGRLPESTVKPAKNYFGLYFQPILIPISFLFKFWPTALFLLLFQSLLIVFSGWAIYQLAERELGRRSAFFLTSSYLSFFGIQNALAFGFYPITLATTFFAFSLYWVQKRRWSLFFLAVFLALLCQENVALYLLFLGIYLLVVLGERKIGFLVILLSLFWYFLIVFYLMPKISGLPYPHFVFEPPWRFFWPPVKIKTFFFLFGSVFFLNFFSPSEVLLSLPMIFEQFLIARPTHWTVRFHYNVSIAPPLFFALVFSLKRWKEKEKLAFLLFFWAFFLTFFFNLPLSKLISPSFYQMKEREKAFLQMVNLVPREASISACDTLVPLLSTRREIYHFSSSREELRRRPQFILLGGGGDCWPLQKKSYEAEVKKIQRSGKYTLIYQRGDKYVFQLRADR